MTGFDDWIAQLADRSAALRAAVTDETPAVPGCPAWTSGDLVAHLGAVQLFWAAAVDSDGERPSDEALGDREVRGQLLAWSEECTGRLLDALLAAEPDQPCWTWWTGSGAPETVAAVARHQVQEAAVHAYDAQDAAKRPEPIPAEIATDSIEEFIAVTLGSSGPWPHPPVRLALRATDGPAWHLDLSEKGARRTDATASAATLTGSASDLLLAVYKRVPLDRLQVAGDRRTIEALVAWPNLE
ncbi:maleylpyruvate isomerase family mycothiol-dependent enzyme [Fodinicola acaciae]|uniref:maleylpyruvate isomerase family mycothiol-dependent enzyme n=1 Tax=Fodinicola acaciae TaxID=2681555 RepID=UPI0013D8D86B|nr:maleylpyruvate isomerase family mycothiol-dependent enzyme [Fodinicola acaciae]